MQITETFSLADLIAVISIAIVTVTSYCTTKQSARQTFDNFLLRLTYWWRLHAMVVLLT